MPPVGARKDIRKQVIVRHAHQHPCRGGGAGQHAGKHADQRAEVDGHAQRRDAGLGCKLVKGTGRIAEGTRVPAKTQDLRIGAEHEEDAGQQRALQYGTGNGLERLARFAAQSRSAFKANEAEDREHQRRSKRGKGRRL